MRLVVLFAFVVALACADSNTQPAPPPPRPVQTDPGGALAVVSGGIQLKPFDDARSDATFVAFRERLQQVVRSRDAAALDGMIDRSIRISFGESNGIAAFRREWKPASAESRLWNVLGTVLSLGGSFQPTPNGSRFVAPYIYSTWPEAVDAFEHVAAVCHDSSVRPEARADAEPFAELEWHVLQIAPDDPVRRGKHEAPWRKVILPDGRPGWIEARCVRSPIDYRAAFEKRDGEWKMVFLVAGD